MKVRVFRSNTGDCLLLSSDSNHILVDGGFKSTFQDHTLPMLAEIAKRKEKLDLVCVSHIDSDHVSGILQLLDDVLAWRVYDFQRAQANNNFKEPIFPRPPQIVEIWHNGFDTVLGDGRRDFEETVELQIQASILGGNELMAQVGQNLIYGERQAIELAHMVAPGLLDIPLNGLLEGKPLVVSKDAPLKYEVGKMNLYLLGPFQEDLDKLQEEWDKWVKDNKAVLDSLQNKAHENARRFGLSQEAALGMWMQRLATELGDRTEVTTPNLASITFLAEEGDELVLMTGDAHADEILKGLRLHGFLPADGGSLHVDVLKIQHHGAEANNSEAFFRLVTADHYVFCGNGSHNNPEVAVVELVVNSRVGEGDHVGENPRLRDPFTIWFNTSEADEKTENRVQHMKKLRDKMETLAEGHVDVVRFHFLENAGSFEIILGEAEAAV